MALFAKRDFQQLANGFFVVDHQDVRHGTARILRSCLSCLHSASFNARKLNYELRAFVSFAKHRDASTVGLNNLVDDGESETSATFEIRLQRLEDFGALLRLHADAGISEPDAQPVGGVFQADRERST